MAVQEVLGLRGFSEAVYTGTTALSGGLASSGNGQCGALSGSAVAISLNYGRDFSGQEDPEAYGKRQKKSYELAKKLHDRFITEYGSILCKDVQTKLMGRRFNFWDEKDKEAFLNAGGHVDKCTSVVGNAAKWTVEIILDAEENEEL